MSFAFVEHSMFALPVDGGSPKEASANRDHPSEDDTTFTEGSYQNSVDYGKPIDDDCGPSAVEIDITLDKVGPPHTVVLCGCLEPVMKSLLLNTTINVFYNCYRAEADQLDPSCLSYLITRSIRSPNSK